MMSYMCSLKELRLSDGAKTALSYILRHGTITKADVCRYMGLGPSTAGKYVSELCGKNLLIESGVADSSGGRRPLLYRLNSSRYLIFCVDISTIYCEMAIVDMSLDVRMLDSFDIKEDDTPDSVISRIIDNFSCFCLRLGVSAEDFLAAGVSVFSSIRDEHGVLYRPIIQYMNEGWEGYPILDKLREGLRIPIFAEKGMNATARLEYNYGKGRHSMSMLYVRCGMNLRSVIMKDGDIIGDSPFAEDAFGHMVIDYDGPRCRCGQYGCLNCYASIPAVMDSFRKEIKKGRGSAVVSDPDSISIEQICHCADDGDEVALSIIDNAARMLGIGLANCIKMFNPETVVLAGLLPEKSKRYYDVATASVRERLSIARLDVDFRRNGSFSHSLMIGAGSTVLDHIIELA